jgi:hypothetical protein
MMDQLKAKNDGEQSGPGRVFDTGSYFGQMNWLCGTGWLSSTDENAYG